MVVYIKGDFLRRVNIQKSQVSMLNFLNSDSAKKLIVRGSHIIKIIFNNRIMMAIFIKLSLNSVNLI